MTEIDIQNLVMTQIRNDSRINRDIEIGNIENIYIEYQGGNEFTQGNYNIRYFFALNADQGEGDYIEIRIEYKLLKEEDWHSTHYPAQIETNDRVNWRTLREGLEKQKQMENISQ